MFYCEDCDSFFEEAKLIRYEDPEIWHQGYKHICPICKSEEIKETVKCVSCGEYTKEHEADNGLCPECQARIQKEAREFIEKYKTEEQEYIIEFLNE